MGQWYPGDILEGDGLREQEGGSSGCRETKSVLYGVLTESLPAPPGAFPITHGGSEGLPGLGLPFPTPPHPKGR